MMGCCSRASLFSAISFSTDCSKDSLSRWHCWASFRKPHSSRSSPFTSSRITSTQTAYPMPMQASEVDPFLCPKSTRKRISRTMKSTCWMSVVAWQTWGQELQKREAQSSSAWLIPRGLMKNSSTASARLSTMRMMRGTTGEAECRKPMAQAMAMSLQQRMRQQQSRSEETLMSSYILLKVLALRVVEALLSSTNTTTGYTNVPMKKTMVRMEFQTLKALGSLERWVHCRTQAQATVKKAKRTTLSTRASFLAEWVWQKQRKQLVYLTLGCLASHTDSRMWTMSQKRRTKAKYSTAWQMVLAKTMSSQYCQYTMGDCWQRSSGMMPFSMLCLIGHGTHSRNCTMCSPSKGMRTEGGLDSSWMNTCTKMSWVRRKKSSKAGLMATRKEAMPKNRARIAHPLNRLQRFRVLALFSTLSRPIYTYLGTAAETNCCDITFWLPLGSLKQMELPFALTQIYSFTESLPRSKRYSSSFLLLTELFCTESWLGLAWSSLPDGVDGLREKVKAQVRSVVVVKVLGKVSLRVSPLVGGVSTEQVGMEEISKGGAELPPVFSRQTITLLMPNFPILSIFIYKSRLLLVCPLSVRQTGTMASAVLFPQRFIFRLLGVQMLGLPLRINLTLQSSAQSSIWQKSKKTVTPVCEGSPVNVFFMLRNLNCIQLLPRIVVPLQQSIPLSWSLGYSTQLLFFLKSVTFSTISVANSDEAVSMQYPLYNTKGLGQVVHLNVPLVMSQVLQAIGQTWQQLFFRQQPSAQPQQVLLTSCRPFLQAVHAPLDSVWQLATEVWFVTTTQMSRMPAQSLRKESLTSAELLLCLNLKDCLCTISRASVPHSLVRVVPWGAPMVKLAVMTSLSTATWKALESPRD